MSNTEPTIFDLLKSVTISGETDQIAVSGTVGVSGTVSTSDSTTHTELTTINTTLGSPMQNSGGSVTANAGTNLNTSALALESGGHLASIDSKLSALPSSVFSGQKTSTGSAVAISISQVITQGVIVQALSTNVKSVYIGPSGVTTSTGFELQPGQATSAAVNNLNLVFIIASNSGDGICYVGS